MKLKATQPVVDLKDPIKPSEFVSPESIKKDRKSAGVGDFNRVHQMPRADEQGSAHEAMSKAVSQKNAFTPQDWEWLRELYRQAIIINEINRRSARRLELDQAEMNHIASMNLSSSKEQRSARQEQITRANLEWREWIDKIVRQSRVHKRELFELFVESLVDKFKFGKILKQRENHEILDDSRTKLAIQRQTGDQRLHAIEESRFHKHKIDQIWLKNDIDIEALNNDRIARLYELRDLRRFVRDKTSQETLLHLMKAMGMRPDFSLLPSKQLELDEENEKISRMRLEIEHNRRVDLHQFRAELAALQSSALSLDHKERFLKKTKPLAAANDSTNETPPKPARNEKDQTMVANNKELDLSSNQTTLTKMKALTPGERTHSDSKTESSQPSEPSPLAVQRPPQKPKLFKPAFPSITPNAVDLKEQNDSLDRLALDKKKEQMENIEAVNLQMSQLQAASQLLQSSLPAPELNKSAPSKDAPALDVRQKIKAAK